MAQDNAVIYYHGYLGTPDYQAAYKWWREAAKQGHIEAQMNLVRLLGDADKMGPEYSSEGIDWLMAAADQGHPTAKYTVGVLLLTASPDSQEGLESLTQAATLGHAEAQYTIGHFYQLGRFGTPDAETARKWLSQAAAQGHVEAQSELHMLDGNHH